jgi:NAD(P)-dependent dehydrogenase (short-subunit alcohol dehydrogenase family)
MAPWTTADIPSQAGRVAVVTGANSGLGLVTARELARAGAEVVLACRDPARGERARADIAGAAPGARVRVEPLDLADLSSVRACATRLNSAYPDGIDLLANNAGVMAIPRRRSADGFEMQLATNHLGHFALTGLLLGALLRRATPRVVTVSSGAHRIGRMRFDDLQGERRYRRWLAYGQSKLANLLFCFELQRRAQAADAPLSSVAAHPGYASTNLQLAGPRMDGSALLQHGAALANRLLGQSAEMGALPELYAATVGDLPGGAYVGPDGRFEQSGYPRLVGTSAAARDEGAARRLWEVSCELTGVRYDFAPAAAAA